ncbi:MAG: insulinase family protein [Pirellulaceae bacterium]|nr:insulinase family protein [Pirellulaceae bacterium]
MEFREQRLENGLEIIAECNPRAHSAALAFFVKSGARDETAEVAGVSHFLEHMVFKGTPRRSAADVNRQLDEVTANSNAFTSEELTVYYATMLPEKVPASLELLSDILRPSLREDDFETEKQVILEEIAKYEDQPPFGAHEKCMAAHFGSHPLSHSVLGTVASVGALTPQQMRAYFQQRYSPDNIVLAATGRIDFDRLVEWAAGHCGGWQPLATSRSAPPPPDHDGLQVVYNELARQQYVVQIANGPAAESDDRYAARLLATVIGDDSGSRFFWALVDTGLADYAAIDPYDFQNAGVYMTSLCCTPDTTADNLRRMRQILEEVELHGVTATELEQARNKICSQVVLGSERPGNRLFAVGGNWVQRREYRTVRQEVDALRAVTLNDIAAVLARYPLTKTTTVAVGPLKEL